jgi:predicted AlkP superfamily pyrophosphatase or phosphodiesterase
MRQLSVFSFYCLVGKSIIFIVIYLTAILVILPGCKKSGRKPYNSYVVLISMDGFRWDYNKLYNTPNINKLATDGVKADRMIPSFPTATFPSHYTIATGLSPDHHGIINNSFFAADLGLFYRIKDRDAVENPSFYGGEPVWITAMKQGAITASFFWVGSEAPVKGSHPTYWKKYTDSITFEARIDTVIKWLRYPRKKRPELVTLYFPEPDAVSSKFGPESNQTGQMVERLDSLIGILRIKLSALPFARKINIILLSDHGMSAISSEKYVNLKEVIPDRMINYIIGSNPVFLIKPVEGKIDSVLFLINSVTGVKAWSKDKMPEHMHYGTNPRIPGIVVVADSSWSIGTRPGSYFTRGGAHGYDNSNSDMFAIFYAAGPAFKKDFKFHELYTTDIYNLICRVLNLQPVRNDGDNSRIDVLLR